MEQIITFFLSAGFFGTLAFFGWVVAVYVLRVRDLYSILGFSLSAGALFFMVVSNALGYVMPITMSFTVTAGLMLLVSVLITLPAGADRYQHLRDIEMPPRKLFLILLTVCLVAGLAYARDRGSDEWVWTHFAMPATILEGNFPVHDVPNPWRITNYHYGYGLLVAGISHLTGLSLSHAHAFLPLFAAAGIIFFAGGLVWQSTKSWGTATLAAIMALAAGGLFWLQGGWLVKDLIQHFFLDQPVEPSPFQWLTPTIRNIYAQPLLMFLGHRAISLGAAAFFGLLYCLRQLLTEETMPRKRALAWIIVAIVFCIALANTLETTFVAFLAGTGLYWLLLLLRIVPAPPWRYATIILMAVCIPAILIALVQGGPLTELSGGTGFSAFSLNMSGRIYHDINIANDSISLLEWRFWRDVGLFLVLFLCACTYIVRQRKQHSFLVLLCSIALFHFFIPLLVFYERFPADILRLFYIAFSVGSVVIAIVLSETWLASSLTWKRRLATACIVVLLTAGTLNAITRLVFPSLNLERTDLFPSMPTISTDERELFTWAKDHSLLSDRFYILDVENEFEHRNDRLLFSTFTGRFVVGSSYLNLDPEIGTQLKILNEHCNFEIIKTFGIRFIVIPGENQVEWFNLCDKKNLTLVYDGGDPYPRVFEVTPQ